MQVQGEMEEEDADQLSEPLASVRAPPATPQVGTTFQIFDSTQQRFC